MVQGAGERERRRRGAPAAMVLLGYREAVSGVFLVVSARSGGVSAWEGASRDEERWQLWVLWKEWTGLGDCLEVLFRGKDRQESRIHRLLAWATRWIDANLVSFTDLLCILGHLTQAL